jgi:EAL domain-containing protein (putative c-di-GMP-specific phosphodiesterase class I)
MTITSVRVQDSDMRAMARISGRSAAAVSHEFAQHVSGAQPGHYTGGIHSQLLLRLVDADRELISPSAFLPAASVSI